MENYTKVRIIGTGSFGTVWLIRSKEKRRNYVLKEIPLSVVEERQRQFVLNEVKVLSKLRHMNIIRYREAFLSNGYLCISMEYAHEGPLFHFVLYVLLNFVLNCTKFCFRHVNLSFAFCFCGANYAQN